METGARTRLAWLLGITGFIGLVLAVGLLPYVGLLLHSRALFQVLGGLPVVYAASLAPAAIAIASVLLIVRGRGTDLAAAGLGLLIVTAYIVAMPTARAWTGRTGNPASFIALDSALLLGVAVVSTVALLGTRSRTKKDS